MVKGGDNPSAVAVGNDGVSFRGKVTDFGNSTYLVQYYPTQAGVFRLYVSVGCCAPNPAVGYAAEIQLLKPLLISGAPFILTVQPGSLTTSKTVAVGDGVIGGSAGDVLKFTILFQDAFSNPTSVPDSSQATFNISFIDTKSGDTVLPSYFKEIRSTSNITVYYILSKAGTYDLSIGQIQPIQGSPYSVLINPARANFSTTICRGVGLRQAALNTTASFEIQLYDSYNNHLITGGNKFHTRLLGDSGVIQTIESAPKCQDTLNGRYICKYKPVASGKHALAVRLLSGNDNVPEGSGLIGRYYSSYDGADQDILDSQLLTKIDSAIDMFWPTGSLSLSLNGSGNHTSLYGSGQSIRWEGYLVSPRTDIFTISADITNANATIFIDSVLVFDNWGSVSLPLTFVADAAYELRIVLKSAIQDALPVSINLIWSTPSVRRHSISQVYLYPQANNVHLSPFPVIVA